jgi:hypothetical protein
MTDGYVGYNVLEKAGIAQAFFGHKRGEFFFKTRKS